MSDQNLFAENARLEAENAALRDGLQIAKTQLKSLGQEFFPLRSKLQDVITTAQEIDRHNKKLIQAGDLLLNTLLWTDEYSSERYNDAREKWEKAKNGNKN